MTGRPHHKYLSLTSAGLPETETHESLEKPTPNRGGGGGTAGREEKKKAPQPYLTRRFRRLVSDLYVSPIAKPSAAEGGLM